ncbi:MAG: hypothetical protein ACRC5M_02495 [Anaeroplasmataceae bacterium]
MKNSLSSINSSLKSIEELSTKKWSSGYTTNEIYEMVKGSMSEGFMEDVEKALKYNHKEKKTIEIEFTRDSIILELSRRAGVGVYEYEMNSSIGLLEDITREVFFMFCKDLEANGYCVGRTVYVGGESSCVVYLYNENSNIKKFIDSVRLYNFLNECKW